MKTERLAHNWVEKLRAENLMFAEGTMVYDAKTIEAMVAEILADGYAVGVEAGSRDKGPRKLRRFSFDVAKLQADARAKMLKDGIGWQALSDDIGIAVNPLKQHLGEKPPADMGIRVMISLLVFLGEFDVLGYLIEEPVL